jgi:hypothetical protein
LKPAKCILKLLKCHKSSEGDGDEVYLKLDNKKIWPQMPYQRIKSMGELKVDLSLLLRGGEEFIRVELWDKDLFSDDLLGHFQFVPSGSQGQYSADIKVHGKNDNHRYTLVWEI